MKYECREVDHRESVTTTVQTQTTLNVVSQFTTHLFPLFGGCTATILRGLERPGPSEDVDPEFTANV